MNGPREIATNPARLAVTYSQQNSARVGCLEQLPKWLSLIPMIGQWAWLSLKHGSWTLPAAANPQIAAGGMVGERKSEYFRMMGPLAHSHVAQFTLLKNARAPSILDDAERVMAEAGLSYPLILKPDIGWCGFGVRIVRNRTELESYLGAYPADEDIMLQHFVPYEGEAGLYYTRWPHEQKGRVTGVLLRFFPQVVGDGHRTIAQLMEHSPRTRRLGRHRRSEPCCDVSRVPQAGEIVRLSVTGSTRVGGFYEDASSLLTPELESAIDAIAMDMRDLHVARFDVRYDSIGAMRAGHSFKILEVNGAGSEAVHAWDPRYTLADAYKIIFAKQRTLFSIGAAMRKLGHTPPSGWSIAKLYLRQQRLIRDYPPSN